MRGDGGSGETEGSGRPALADQRGVESVYQPAEDSALLARAVSERVDDGDRTLDVGTGSGFVAATMAEAGADAVGVDVNPLACQQARKRGVTAVRGNLVDPFRDEVFDLVAFNPPYLPTPAEKEWDDWMEHALSGGEDGRRLVDPFLESVGRVLAPDGEALLLVSSLTDPDAVREYARQHGLVGEQIASEKHPYERLVVLRFVRN
ncbi:MULTISPECIES: HemK2/MTQ2 family protein methyltransferase [Haloarcula]|uniref:Methyltransferase n=1 Tax=Haloarcula pellucida TaxID=1427151 RepID=A0A830GG79_9EURY|nr:MULTISPECIES: HemK2/MTQ2 family protein methyltransferase [Halomicroarcula]MBX0347117.1 methyltransferase domain-containing protein [Halomicroarcula pellucida]MDS0277008.1 class I SAM-dependent methyltransferase [Halomicroarcula sp. S1AR25-4]GGN87071.1 methyltransferase [Halomicroarcula pellucida]